MPSIGDLVGQLKQPNDRPAESRRQDAGRLPLEARVARDGAGWQVRLPVRAEQVRVEKQSVVAEQVVVRRRTAMERATVGADLRREELDVSSDTGLSYDESEPVPRTRRGYRPPYEI